MNLLGSDGHPWVTAIAGAAVLALSLMFLAGGYTAVMRRRTRRRLPEGDWRIWTGMYSAATVRQHLLDAGDRGWRAYRLLLWSDVVYSVLFGVAGVVLLDGVFGRYFGVDLWWLRLLDLLPAFAAAADILEDASLLRAIGRPPAEGEDPPAGLPHPGAIGWARWFTRGKWVLYPAVLVPLLVGAVRLIQLGP